ncbi:hypothetical protein V1264_014160 [Littorina saxatilis]|uniref:Uncharacterized protein n=1 Tax=Littorina saxatilis TaxID=31220 RepID=A0AAN9GIN3_9CAEN
MPHIMSDMAGYQHENRKAAAQRRKPLRKGSPTHNRGKGSMICGSPPVRVFYRQDIYVDTQSDSALNVVDAPLLENVSSMQFQDVCAGMSPPKVSSNPTTKSGAGIRHAPSPAFLPQPPKHWMGEADLVDQVLDICIDTKDAGSAISNQLKMLLKVQG